jgi:hypothetical protein
MRGYVSQVFGRLPRMQTPLQNWATATLMHHMQRDGTPD